MNILNGFDIHLYLKKSICSIENEGTNDLAYEKRKYQCYTIMKL